MGSLLIDKVTIIDGTSADAFEGQLLVENDIINGVLPRGTLPRYAANEYFDGEGKILTPGFVDVHGHSDLSALASPECAGKISSGITTEVVGNCGLSAFPVTDFNREHLQQLWSNYQVKITWSDFHSYQAQLKCRQVKLNLYSLCGHNTLRSAVCGYDDVKIDASRIMAMKNLLQTQLQQGACGFSSGLLYVPGVFSTSDELVELLRTLAGFDRPYATHLRSEKNRLLEALEEAIAACEKSGQKHLHISHLKTGGAENFYKITALLKRFDLINSGGSLKMSADRYPYIHSMTQLSVILPAPFDVMSDVKIQDTLQNDDIRRQLEQELSKMDSRRFEQIILCNTASLKYLPFCGQTISQIARSLNCSSAKMIVEILQEDSVNTTAAFAAMSEDNMQHIIAQNFTVCGSDESSRPLDYAFGRSHPRGIGSMAEFIQNLKAQGFSWEKAVYKVTGLAAELFNLNHRGKIKPGFKADLVLSDLENYRSNATFAHPHARCSGIDTVWNNGKMVWSNR